MRASSAICAASRALVSDSFRFLPPCRKPSAFWRSTLAFWKVSPAYFSAPASRAISTAFSASANCSGPLGLTLTGTYCARCIFDGSAQHYRVAVRINHRSEMDENFGATFDVSAALHALDLALNISSRRNHNVVIDDAREGGLGIYRIAVSGCLC